MFFNTSPALCLVLRWWAGSFSEEYMTYYTKTHLTVEEQIKLLRERGMTIDDVAQAKWYLRTVGYYRLAGYWHGLRIEVEGELERRSEFNRAASFDEVVATYEFDRELRLLIFDAIERIEVMLRFQIAHVVGKSEAFAHRDPENYSLWFKSKSGDDASQFEKLLARVNRDESLSRETFAKHHIEKYGKPLPIWKAAEVLDFRTISEMYRGLNQKFGDQIARGLNVITKDGNGDSGVFGNWLRNLGYVRNICAHHSRLWNRNIGERIQPKSFKKFVDVVDVFGPYLPDQPGLKAENMARVYPTIVMISLLLEEPDSKSSWLPRVLSLIRESFPGKHSVAEMGFPLNFEKLPFWSPYLSS
jgi:abortive infection bacteriophage resistance protein